MRLDQIQNKAVGEFVGCPSDRGDPQYTGQIEHISSVICYAGQVPYLWVTVRRPHGGHSSVWPSNRLG